MCKKNKIFGKSYVLTRSLYNHQYDCLRDSESREKFLKVHEKIFIIRGIRLGDWEYYQKFSCY